MTITAHDAYTTHGPRVGYPPIREQDSPSRGADPEHSPALHCNDRHPTGSRCARHQPTPQHPGHAAATGSAGTNGQCGGVDTSISDRGPA